jgi:phosphoribosylaminoimidazole-succinocarboxamide synthase
MKLLRRGKVKEVYEASEDELEFFFTDNISVFDKVIPTQIPHKGETLCRTSAHWFVIAQGMDIRTHYLGLRGGNRMRIRRVRVIEDYSQINPRSKDYLIPLEWISRYYVAGSLHDRLKSGQVKPEALGLTHVPQYGEELPQPFFEYTTHLEKVDREVDREEALRIGGLTAEDLEDIREVVLRVDERMAKEVRRGGLIHVDGKKEFAFDRERGLMLVDTFGTADEDRWWDLKEWKVGRCVELSKEFVRQYYRAAGYHDKLTEARRRGLPEPPIPPLPEEKVKEVSDLYIRLYERLTDEVFRLA